ncbi:hypothetical protein AOX55_00004046 [Sinorhizobium fredii CCBAU 25509]|nr:hypothetical protein AOX55_00004046 [Sinorhizobium fredii CCBAU 25509]
MCLEQESLSTAAGHLSSAPSFRTVPSRSHNEGTWLRPDCIWLHCQLHRY